MDKKSCLYCFYTVEVKNISQLEPGMHVRFGRYGVKGIGFLYWHHAIVIAVNITEDTITLIEFAKANSKQNCAGKEKSENEIRKKLRSLKVHIVKETTRFDDEKMKNMFIVKHKLSNDYLGTVQRAEDIYQQFQTGDETDLSYNLFNNNCEHLALYCSTGNSTCVQLDDVVDKSFEIMITAHEVIRFLGNIDKFSQVKVVLANVSGWFLEGFITLDTIVSIVSECNILNKQFNKGIMCTFCWKSRLFKAVSCIVFSFVKCAAFYTICFLTNGALTGVIILGVVSLIVSVVIYISYSYVRHRKEPIRKSQKFRVTSFRDVKPGDVINYSNYHLPHDAIVLKCFPEKEIKVGFEEIEDKVIMRKCATLNVETVTLWKNKRDISCRARNTLLGSFRKPGSQLMKSDALGNPNHLLLMKKSKVKCFPLRTACSSKEYVAICEENGIYCLHADEFRKLSVERLDMVAKSFIRVHSANRQKAMQERYDKGKGLNYWDQEHLKIFIIDFLEKEGICMRISNPLHVRATLKHLDQRLQTEKGDWKTAPVEELVPGDIVEVPIDGRIKTAVILETCPKAKLEIIHYNFDDVKPFLYILRQSSRVVRKETINFDCRRQRVLKHEFDESLVNPPEVVVERANKCLGNRNWKFSKNWSSDFARHCKLRPEESSIEASNRIRDDIQGNVAALLQ